MAWSVVAPHCQLPRLSEGQILAGMELAKAQYDSFSFSFKGIASHPLVSKKTISLYAPPPPPSLSLHPAPPKSPRTTHLAHIIIIQLARIYTTRPTARLSSPLCLLLSAQTSLSVAGAVGWGLKSATTPAQCTLHTPQLTQFFHSLRENQGIATYLCNVKNKIPQSQARLYNHVG